MLDSPFLTSLPLAESYGRLIPFFYSSFYNLSSPCWPNLSISSSPSLSSSPSSSSSSVHSLFANVVGGIVSDVKPSSVSSSYPTVNNLHLSFFLTYYILPFYNNDFTNNQKILTKKKEGVKEKGNDNFDYLLNNIISSDNNDQNNDDDLSKHFPCPSNFVLFGRVSPSGSFISLYTNICTEGFPSSGMLHNIGNHNKKKEKEKDNN
jgi:hypothetical protein